MKKTIISVFAITSLVAVNLTALKFRLKPPKKEVFNIDVRLLKEEEQEFLQSNIDANSSLEPMDIEAYQDFCHSLGDVILSNQLKIEDIPQDLRLIGGSELYRKSWLSAKKHHDVEQYILTFKLILNDIKFIKEENSFMRKDAINLVLNELISGMEFFNEDEAIVDFVFENKVVLEGFGIYYDPKPKSTLEVIKNIFK